MADIKGLMVDIDVIMRNLNILKERLLRHQGTHFEPNISEMKSIRRRVKTIKSKSAELTY